MNVSTVALRNIPGTFIRILDENVLQEFYKKLPAFYFKSYATPNDFDKVRADIKKKYVDGIIDDDGNLLHRPSSPRLIVEYLRSITPGFYNRSYRKHMPRPAILDRQW